MTEFKKKKKGKELASYGLVGTMAINQKTLQKVKLKLKKDMSEFYWEIQKEFIFLKGIYFFSFEDRIQRDFLNEVQIFLQEYLLSFFWIFCTENYII